MAVLHKWYGLVLFALTCLAITMSEAKCRGRTVLTDLQGTISDGPSKYPANTLCEWLIKGPYPNVSITLTFIEFATECSYDFLFIHDGDSYLSPLIASISGNTTPNAIIVAHSGMMLINLYSDADYILDGFTLNYTIENCTRGCSGRGSCKDGYCLCDKLYRGKACELDACPLHCITGEQHGQCNYAQEHCECNHGYIGEGCSLPTLTNANTNKWFNISSTSSVFTPRIAHSVVYIENTDALLAFGGYSLNKVFDDLLQFSFVTSLWSEIQPGDPTPIGRFSHSSNAYLDSMVLFGGESQNGSLNNDLWLYNLTLNKWIELAVNNTVRPPPVAEHTATIVDDKLYIFGGRTDSDPFSSAMYSYSLSSQTGWTKVSYKRGNKLHLRMLGHSAFYYSDMRSIIVFGGFAPKVARASTRSDRLLAFHLDLLVWSELAVTADSGAVPRGRAFHSAVLVGDYMVIYGGNIHKHNNTEQCYENKPFFYHLKCQKWIPQRTFEAQSSPSSNPQQGRFSHQAVLRNGTVMLVVGGFNGLPLGEILGYKLPIAVAEKSPVGSHCGGYSTDVSCKNDPECGWCGDSSSRCLSLGQSGSCGGMFSTGSCPGQCAVYTQCTSCLSFGNSLCGWCVQDSRCYPITSPTGACQAVTNSNKVSLRGWWGTEGQFRTSLDDCQSMDFPPGLTVVENKKPPNSSHPDGIRIASVSEVTILASPQVVKTKLIGFIYPFKYLSAPWITYELTLVRSKTSFREAKLWLSTDETNAGIELVAHCNNPAGSCTVTHNQIFPSPSEGKRYFVIIEVSKVNDQKDSINSVFSLQWNRTSSDTYVRESLTGQFLQPYASTDCSVHKTCLACMTDAACGWCVTSCMSRNSPAGPCRDSEGNEKHIALNVSECTVCFDHVDCTSCNQDSNCVWGMLSELGCYRRGQLNEVIEHCGSPCSSRNTCDSCLSDKVGCAWCDKTQSCFVLGTYTSRYPYGQCSHWLYSNAGDKCANCSQHTNCTSCLADVRCGWCGNDYDPRIGRCFSGDFNSPYSGKCPTIFPTNGSTIWSYPTCPDVDECKLGIAKCHHNATCVNVPGSFSCICNRGFTGDGILACNKTCFHDCGIRGVCSADFTCDCNLGWLGENCSIDCGCHGHSDCPQGIGICDRCQDYTRGSHCEFCVPGSFGNATTAKGCKPCQCNGHGDPTKNLCDISTGKCFCTDFTIGDNCDTCMPGLLGNPKNGGLCFHECAPRSILTNITQGYISTQLGSGVTSKAEASCLWLISSLTNTSHEVVYGPSPPPKGSRGLITLTFKEIQISCLTDHVDVYDGLPPFLLGQSPSGKSFFKLGSFCGWNATKLKPVTAMLGNMVVVIKANLSSVALSKGFSAKFSVKKCPELCGGNQRCMAAPHGEKCVCLEGWTGDNCDQLVCPNNCSSSKRQGHCNLTLGGCVCSSGFASPDCSQAVTPGTGLWEVLSDVPHLNVSISPVARMGHTVVHTAGSLLVYAGYSLAHGLLSDLLSFNLSTHTWSPIEVNQVPSQIPAARFLHSAVFHVDSMLIYGGQLEDGSSDQSLWLFNITALQWNKLELASQGPKVAGHSATLVGNNMIIIGGYDRFLGFNEATYIYNVLTKQWTILSAEGLSPKGLYGHTAVYYAAKQVILVFGGYRFRIDRVRPSDALYSLNLVFKSWSLLQALPFNEPQPKYFHSAVIVNGVMVVFGGRSNTTDHLISRQLLSYNIKCHYWYLYPDQSLVGSKPGGLLSAAAIAVADKIYIFGGYNGQTQATLFRLTLPSDLCQAIASKEKCAAVPTCSWCKVHNITQQGNTTVNVPTDQSACYSVMSSVPGICQAEPNVTLVVFRNGSDCSEPSTRSCGSLYSCSECLASFPHPSAMPKCKWCFGCRSGGKCIESFDACSAVHPCNGSAQDTRTDPRLCVANHCEATSCAACVGLGSCMWTPQLHWLSEALRFLSKLVSHPFHWNCMEIQFSPKVTIKSPPQACPLSCTVYRDCDSCLKSRGGDGGWKECVWSETLGQCFSPSYLPIICLAGRCGRVIRGSPNGCMGSCASKQHCRTCMTSYNCGWCAEKGTSGEGQCFEGGLQGPVYKTCEAHNVTSNASHVWASMLCPLENECKYGKHNCSLKTEECVDTPESYKCICRPGYDDTEEPGKCKPVCSKGCVQGNCVRPEICQCHFGWTSTNCSVKCLCNEHGLCANETHLDVCHDCRNHTVGRSCEFCAPLYVGDSRNNGSCVSCFKTCNGRANVCMNSTQLEYGRARNLSFEIAEVKKWLKQGPYRIENDKECLCKNNSNDVKCKSCIPGFFDDPDDSRSCTRCLCNGHADSCDKDGACNCQNNTEEDCPSKKDCYKTQCVKCKDHFMGNPINNQQCYRKISFRSQFVIGHKTAEPEDSGVNALPYGQAIFYVIYPRFTNVNIRLTTDVFNGEVDLYVANENDEFTVEYNHTTGHQQVNVKGLASNTRKRRETQVEDSSNSGSNIVDEVTASVKLNTFINFNGRHKALIVRRVRHRLVLTFPYSEHHLRDVRFYMVFVGRDKSGSRGLVYFRQDLSQIDLFVFFSVFFSAFFLVVSMSVFGWKIKQYHTRRRVIEVREHQLVTMRSRPYATYSFLHQSEKPEPSCWRVKRDIAALVLRDPSAVKHHQLRLRDVRERPLLAPISHEPTGDGKASVTTVVFQLPGNECSDFQLLLGSALTVVTNQHSVNGVEHHTSHGRKTSTRRTVTFTS